jgi:hypothetical protein
LFPVDGAALPVRTITPAGRIIILQASMLGAHKQ